MVGCQSYCMVFKVLQTFSGFLFNGSSPLLEIYKIVSFKNGSFDIKLDKGRR